MLHVTIKFNKKGTYIILVTGYIIIHINILFKTSL
jgi:hypothetical protein